MKHQKWLSLLLAICMVVTLLPSIVSAEENVLFSEDVYDDISLETATGTLNGSGTAADPFQIWTAGDLYLVNYVESWNYWNAQDGSEFKTYYYKQMADLDLSGAEQFTKTYGYILSLIHI